MDSQNLDGRTFVDMVSGGAANLKANVDIVNDMNVFPIPDGDTGENMSRTIEGGVRSLKGHEDASLDEAAELVADGMLMNARGNSGVILSQIFGGIAESLRGKMTANVKDLSEAMLSGVRKAYAAVVNPVEGTILTVAREAAEYAASRVTDDSTLESFGEYYEREMSESLQRTPDMLEALKEAGVVDSGGAGLLYIVQGLFRTMRGEKIETQLKEAPAAAEEPKELDFSLFTEDSEMEYGYCTEFFLRLQNCKDGPEDFSIKKFRKYLSKHGDSVVAFRNGTIVKAHVHTLEPGVIFNYAQRYGEFLSVKVENMTLQHSETIPQEAVEEPAEETVRERVPFAVIAVAMGEGIKSTFAELGADYIIEGGQGHNPSTKEFLAAFEHVNADTVFVLPNNSNILLVARQAAAVYKDSNIVIIASRNIGEGYAALQMVSFESGDPDQIRREMIEAMNGVRTGMVTVAVRKAEIDGVAIEKGHYIGFTNKRMLVSDPERTGAGFALLEAMEADDYEILIAIYGKDVTAAEKEMFRNSVSARFSDVELYEIDGGQDVYDFLLILE